ncbi:MAG: EamA family transporter RarD [Planctomycetota bacterium]|nr:EamA family transporter RarD [Planctomycetota bacterium]MDA0968860.1 EamA family transporter RarD [Planctomycetota bacterium]
MNTGYVYAAAAFILWGILPVFWKQLDTIPATQLVAHRVVWSTLVLLPLVWVTGHGQDLRAVFRSPQRLFRQALAAVFVGGNWLGFVWAVTNGRMIESSLGYFLNPLLSVLLGVFLLGERLRPVQWLAVAIAATGVAWLAGQYHHFPWIALFLAGSFCLYGLAKKKTSLPALSSLTVETLLLLTPAVVFLASEHAGGRGAFGQVGWQMSLLMMASGVITAVPLLCFSVAAQRIPLSAIGLMQYLGPSLQFLLGLFVYEEPFDAGKLVGFVIVWIALAIYAASALTATRAKPHEPSG